MENMGFGRESVIRGFQGYEFKLKDEFLMKLFVTIWNVEVLKGKTFGK